jgi:RNA polymerase sigma factor (sigma-70 family)
MAMDPQRNPRFLATRWSVVQRVRDENPEVAQAALTELCQIYWYPLYAYMRRCGQNHHDAEDLTQALLLDLLHRKSLNLADPQKGRFRTFLLTAAKRFMANAHDHANAAKRGGTSEILSIDMSDAQNCYAQEPADTTETPEKLYDRRWSLTLLNDALTELKQEYAKKGKTDLFEDLRVLLVQGGHDVSYAALGEKHGMSENHIKVTVFRMRRRFGAVLHQKVAHTVASPADVEDEIRYLMGCLGHEAQTV